MRRLPKELSKEIEEFELKVVCGRLARLEVQPIILEEIKRAQVNDEYLKKVWKNKEDKVKEGFTVSPDGSLRYKERLCVPEVPELKEQLLKEAHQTPYSVHPRTT